MSLYESTRFQPLFLFTSQVLMVLQYCQATSIGRAIVLLTRAQCLYSEMAPSILSQLLGHIRRTREGGHSAHHNELHLDVE